MCGLFVEIQFSESVEIQFNHIIAFGKGCVLLVSDFLLLQPKLLLRPKLDINGSNYIGSKTEIDSTRKETHLLKGQFRQRVIMEERGGKEQKTSSCCNHWHSGRRKISTRCNCTKITLALIPFTLPILKKAVLLI